MKISDLLELKEKKTVISISGGGGKTSTLFRLAYELKKYKVLITTTTKILRPESSDEYDIINEENSATFLKVLKQNPHKNLIVCGSSSSNGSRKLIGCTLPFLNDVKDYFDYILIEADGSAGRPLKAPAPHEPVIADFTDIYIGVIGLDCLGKHANSQNVHRPEYFSIIRKKKEEEIITDEDLLKLINSPIGLFKDAPKKCRKIVLLNKADVISQNNGEKIVSYLSSFSVIPAEIILNSYKQKNSVLFSKKTAVSLNKL